jgi:hypothetical protein
VIPQDPSGRSSCATTTTNNPTKATTFTIHSTRRRVRNSPALHHENAGKQWVLLDILGNVEKCLESFGDPTKATTSGRGDKVNNVRHERNKIWGHTSPYLKSELLHRVRSNHESPSQPEGEGWALPQAAEVQGQNLTPLRQKGARKSGTVPSYLFPPALHSFLDEICFRPIYILTVRGGFKPPPESLAFHPAFYIFSNSYYKY